MKLNDPGEGILIREEYSPGVVFLVFDLFSLGRAAGTGSHGNMLL